MDLRDDFTFVLDIMALLECDSGLPPCHSEFEIFRRARKVFSAISGPLRENETIVKYGAYLMGEDALRASHKRWQDDEILRRAVSPYRLALNEFEILNQWACLTE